MVGCLFSLLIFFFLVRVFPFHFPRRYMLHEQIFTANGSTDKGNGITNMTFYFVEVLVTAKISGTQGLDFAGRTLGGLNLKKKKKKKKQGKGACVLATRSTFPWHRPTRRGKEAKYQLFRPFRDLSFVV